MHAVIVGGPIFSQAVRMADKFTRVAMHATAIKLVVAEASTGNKLVDTRLLVTKAQGQVIGKSKNGEEVFQTLWDTMMLGKSEAKPGPDLTLVTITFHKDKWAEVEQSRDAEGIRKFIQCGILRNNLHRQIGGGK